MSTHSYAKYYFHVILKLTLRPSFVLPTQGECAKRLKKDIISLKDMINPAKQIHNALIKNNKTLAVAESCTGGLLSKILTDNPGSSRYFLLGIIAYNNRIKIDILGIPPMLITKKGAVSKETARKMAESIRKLAKADFGIGITGIAGPSGKTKAKPVGTVFIAVANSQKTLCRKFHSRGNRSSIRKQAALKSLILLANIF